ncbi:OLC1v1038490C1 [Oldenlandia corymbosa var. corymbosa]|uniref:OLC1v1038490C1 n=1 Tax=Oldenlandia corymbosa var. corymbosa TaxID=529605 RepID=A0AAV1D317_OLDCO|nr:OLC1v1038490C1 [Oldenlandia corymbosa var. corymbosa]
MLLQPTTSKPPLNLRNNGQNNNVPISSNFSYSVSIPSGLCNSAGVKPIRTNKDVVFTCRISHTQVHSYGTVDFEKRPGAKWSIVYKRILNLEDPNKGSAAVLNQWEIDGNRLSKWDLSRVIKELRKFKRFKLALEVYEWMNNRSERYRVTTSDTAIQLDLIAKVRGISSAEEYFQKLPDSLKDKRVYGALLNAYVHAKKREEAESLMDELRIRGYASMSLPYNVIMTLYLNFKEYEKVELMISEMMEKNIKLDIYSYNIWMSSCGAQGSVEKMEQVLEKMKLDTTIIPNWTTYSTMATVYIRLGEMEKAFGALKNVEGRLTGRDRIPYHYLMSLYGTLGKKEEVYRVWNVYKSLFSRIPNLGYHSLISSLVRLGDIEGAENIYKEWLSVKTMFDPRIGNLLLGFYVRNDFPDKAKAFFDEMIEVGGKANPTTWEILAEDHIRAKRISEALSCIKKAVSAEGSRSWRPRIENVSSILMHCEKEDDMASKEVLLGILKQVGCLDDEIYMSYVFNRTLTGVEPTLERDQSGDDDESEMLLKQLQGSL